MVADDLPAVGIDIFRTIFKYSVFGQQHVSSAGFPTPTSLASAARIFPASA